jgi:hypothetical protein
VSLVARERCQVEDDPDVALNRVMAPRLAGFLPTIPVATPARLGRAAAPAIEPPGPGGLSVPEVKDGWVWRSPVLLAVAWLGTAVVESALDKLGVKGRMNQTLARVQWIH